MTFTSIFRLEVIQMGKKQFIITYKAVIWSRAISEPRSVDKLSGKLGTEIQRGEMRSW